MKRNFKVTSVLQWARQYYARLIVLLSAGFVLASCGNILYANGPFIERSHYAYPLQAGKSKLCNKDECDWIRIVREEDGQYGISMWDEDLNVFVKSYRMALEKVPGSKDMYFTQVSISGNDKDSRSLYIPLITIKSSEGWSLWMPACDSETFSSSKTYKYMNSASCTANASDVKAMLGQWTKETTTDLALFATIHQ